MFKLKNDEVIKNIEEKILRKDIPIINVGDQVKLGITIVEGNKERVQFFQGLVIATRNYGINTTITVRRVVEGVGMERVFLIHSPKIASIKILRNSKIRRSKLYYLRKLKGKAGRLKQSKKSTIWRVVKTAVAIADISKRLYMW